MSGDPRLTSLQLWPALDPATESALRESIRRWGVLVPVAKDQHGRTLDGHHRARIADDIGETYAVIVHHVADDDEARELARTLNSDRRHLTTDQRRDMVAHLRELGHSYPAIAKAIGASVGTVYSDAQAFRVESLAEPPARVVGADGKSYPARRPTVFAANDGEAARASAKMAMLPLDALPIGPSTAADIERSVRLVKEAKREERRDENRQAIATAPTLEAAVTAGRFAAIVIDPPWDWGDEGDVDQLGRARPTYATMPFDDLLALPVGERADDDAHLYLWITNRSLPKGFALIEAWGFRYITCLTWVKPSFGMGNYFRGQTEHVLFGVKGSQALKRKDVGTSFSAQRGPRGHSSKPVEFYDLVESCSPGPYLEVFARGERDGWVSWGGEL